MDINHKLIHDLAEEIKAKAARKTAIALDFDGVCKLFTEHKHQIMRTCLFIHLFEFQRLPFKVYAEAYQYINFRSPDYAGKERFFCVYGLSEFLAQKGYGCALPGLRKAVGALKSQGLKISGKNLQPFASENDVSRILAWSAEVDQKLAKLTEIGLTPGILDQIFTPFRTTCDFYVVSTATEATLQPQMQKEGIDFILRYMGQETATKSESLLALCEAGYEGVFMFGDSVEDSRASLFARDHAPKGSRVFFVPVIPGDEERCFSNGRRAIESCLKRDIPAAERLCETQLKEFQGKEVTV